MSVANPIRPKRSLRERFWQGRGYAAAAALAIAVVAALALGFAGFGVREEMFDLDYAVRTLATGWAPVLALVGGVLGALTFLAGVLATPRGDRVLSLLAVVLAVAAYVGSAKVAAVAAANPPIHDVATDWQDPLIFGSSVAALRGPDADPVRADPVVQPQPQDPDLTGTRVAEVNARTCPGATPLVVPGEVQAAYDKARAVLTKRQMPLTTENPAAGRIEAVAAMPWLKLKSDVLVRVQAEGAGARIDLRSVSRTGIADLGWNCRLVTDLRREMAD